MKRLVTYKEARKVLIQNGWYEIRCKGDHHQFKDPKSGRVVTLPGKSLSDTLSPGVVSNIEKTTGLSLRR